VSSRSAIGSWAVVIPVKGSAGKSRLDPDSRRIRLAWALARDTVAAARATPGVAELIVVTAEPDLASRLLPGAQVVSDPGSGLNGAIRAGLLAVRDGRRHRAVLLGDLPALSPAELARALRLAAERPRSMVADSAGTGTTLVTARAGLPHSLHFGRGSRALHRAAGYRELPFRSDSGLRQDIDTLADLAVLSTLRPGRHTRAALRPTR
jgi:2-phospho-L-lactate guanylyltransferase